MALVVLRRKCEDLVTSRFARTLPRTFAVLALALATFGCSAPEARPEADEAAAEKPSEAADEASETGPDGTEIADEAGRESLSPPGAAGAGAVLAQVRAEDTRGDREIADHYYRTGVKFFQAGHMQKAFDNFKRALDVFPAHPEARDLYARSGKLLGVREGELQSDMEQWGQEARVKAQLLRTQMLNTYRAGEKAFNEGDLEKAIHDLERVEQIIAYSAYKIDPGAGADSYRERSRRLIAEAKDKKQRAEFEMRRRLEQQSLDRAIYEEERQKLARQDKIRTMLDQAADLLRSQRYERAQSMADEILELDPQNTYAKKLREYSNNGIHLQKNAEIHENRTREYEENWRDVERATVPQEFDVLRFSDDWVERTKDRRPGISEKGFEEPFWVQKMKKTLQDRKVSLNFKDVSLRDVILFLQDVTDLNFVFGKDIDPEGLNVTLKLTNMKLENALEIALGKVGLTYIFDKESILIIEPGTALGETYFDLYDVSDLLFAIKDFPAPRMTLPDPDQQGGGPGGGGGPLIFSDDDDETGEAITGDTLADIVRSATGGDDVWDGDRMSIEPHKGQLLVTATREYHQKVLEVLDKIRQNQGWFVHVETRFIEMNNDMLEDFGVDFRGLGGNPGDETLVRGQANPNPILATGPTNQIGTPVDFGPFQRNMGGTDSGVLNSDQNLGGGFGRNFGPGVDNFTMRTQNAFGNAFGPAFGKRLQGGSGLSMQIAKLDPFQVNAIIRAEYQSERVHLLTAPRVTAANREKVYVSVVTQRAYISDWDLISGGTGLTVIEVPDPVVETLQEGVVLEVRPTISSDRKYVTLDCRPSLATLVGGQINTVIVNLGAVSMAAIAVPIGVPEITLQEAFTSVTIPDGGTALLGGFRQLNERREESSMPFVDNIPLLNVLFRRKTEVKEMKSLVILVTAKIISIRDEEAKLFNRPD